MDDRGRLHTSTLRKEGHDQLARNEARAKERKHSLSKVLGLDTEGVPYNPPENLNEGEHVSAQGD